MSAWSVSQRTRLAYEEALLTQEVSDFYFCDRELGGLTTVRGNYTSSSNNTYQVCIWIKIQYPIEMPGLYVTYPQPLIGYGGRSIHSYGTSHSMHIWESDWNNYVKICHTKSEYWSPSMTLLNVLMKGFLWLEAYEAHKRTGNYIDYYSLSF
jgi:hypothetical protein